MAYGSDVYSSRRLQSSYRRLYSRARDVRVVVVERDESSFSVRNNQFEQPLFCRASDVRMMAQRRDGLVNYVEDTACKGDVLFGVKFEDALETALSLRGIDYAGHFFARGRRAFFPSAR